MTANDILFPLVDDDDLIVEIVGCTECLEGRDERPEAVMCFACESAISRFLRLSAPTSGREHWEVDAPPIGRMEGVGL